MSLFGSYIEESCKKIDQKTTVSENFSFANSIAEVSFLEGAIVAESATFEMLTEGFDEFVFSEEAENSFKEKAATAGKAIKDRAIAAFEKIIQFFTNLSNKVYVSIMSKIGNLESSKQFKKDIKIKELPKSFKNDIDHIDNAADSYKKILTGSKPSEYNDNLLKGIEDMVAKFDDNCSETEWKAGSIVNPKSYMENLKAEKESANKQAKIFTDLKASALKYAFDKDNTDAFKKYLADAVKVGRLSMTYHNKAKNVLYSNVANILRAQGTPIGGAKKEKEEATEEK